MEYILAPWLFQSDAQAITFARAIFVFHLVSFALYITYVLSRIHTVAHDLDELRKRAIFLMALTGSVVIDAASLTDSFATKVTLFLVAMVIGIYVLYLKLSFRAAKAAPEDIVPE